MGSIWSISTAWSIGRAVGALALQILIPGIIDFVYNKNDSVKLIVIRYDDIL